MKLLYILMISSLITGFIFAGVQGNGTASENHISTASLDIENSIIIKGITLESDEYPESFDQGGETGEIIYSDSFIDSVIEENKGASRFNCTDKKDVLARLKIRDKRWHLTDYIIKKNDNLWTIARNFDSDHRLIISVNRIQEPDHLLPGKKILVPSRKGVFYRIRKGDTLSEIASRYKSDPKQIAEQNELKQNAIYAGQKIFLPDARKQEERKKSSMAQLAEENRNRLVAKGEKISLLWPLKGKITSGFGTRKDPFSGKKKFHCGIDISANVGTPVLAALDGNVIFSGWKQGYGKVIIIRHDNGYITVYAHNSKNLVKIKNRVSKGQLIARSGMTGAVTGAHLHFEFRKYLTPLNPMRFL